MKLTLLVSDPDECGLCADAIQAFNKQFGREQAHEEARVINLDENEEYQEKWMEAELPLAPVVILETDEGKIISTIEVEDLLGVEPKKAEETAPPAPAENPQ